MNVSIQCRPRSVSAAPCRVLTPAGGARVLRRAAAGVAEEGDDTAGAVGGAANGVGSET